MNQTRKVLILLMAITMFADFILTFLGQPREYWSNFQAVNEGSPLGAIFLMKHPFYFVVFYFLWAGLAFYLIARLRLFFALFFGIAAILGHIYAAISWLSFLSAADFLAGGLSWYLRILYVIVLAFIFSIVIKRGLR